MPWKTCDAMDSRQSFIEDFNRAALSFSELCRRHQISRTNGYKWLRRHESEGPSGLLQRSRKPHTSPTQSTAALEAKVLVIRREHPAWGGRKIRQVLINEGCAQPLPAPSTISNILRRHGLLGAGMREGSAPTQRFERGLPNELWQMDFKGWIALEHGQRCYPLTLLDDHSRYNLVLHACRGESDPVVRGPLTEAFRRFGLPDQILCDHGNPWGKGLGADGRQVGTPTFERWLMRLGVELIHGRVRHPQTQGKEERFHRTLQVEVIRRESLWRDLAHCQSAFTHWQQIYNEKRPHEALGMQTPSSRYTLSQRSYPERLAPEESFYLPEDIIRRVKSKGEITFRNHFFYVGRAFIAAPVALRHRGCDVWDLFYCWKQLGTVDLALASKQKGRYHSIKAETVTDVCAHL